MKLGGEPKKVAILAGLLLVAGYFLYTDRASSPAGSAKPAARSASARSLKPEVTPSPAEEQAPVRTAVARTGAPRRNEQEFRPSFKNKGVDPGSIDPNLRLDLLAKVRSVEVGPAARNLFAWGAAPPPQLPPGVKEIGKIVPKPNSPGGQPLTGDPAQPPPPPPITLKYYGYTAQRSDGHKRAFFSEGDCSATAGPTAPQCDIFVAAEGDLIMKRYKVVRIGVSSAEVEDTQFNHTQPLPITQESPG